MAILSTSLSHRFKFWELQEPRSLCEIQHGIIRRLTPHSQQVKGGGHATNPGFSSTTGVQIAMTRFSDVEYDPLSGTATIGAGLVWDDVYEALEPLGINVAGGRVSGIGVAGKLSRGAPRDVI